MFAYINGMLAVKSNQYIVIDVNGVGYKIFMPPNSIEELGEIGQIVKVHTYYYVREDNISLYGFKTSDELRMFELLLSVSGIGAKSAITMLSEISTSSFALAVISNDTSKLVKIPGIGAKTAARIVLELKDKLKTESAMNKEEKVATAIKEENKSNEVVEALQVLGYNKKEIDKVLEKIDYTNLSIEEMIKKSLTLLSQ